MNESLYTHYIFNTLDNMVYADAHLEGDCPYITVHVKIDNAENGLEIQERFPCDERGCFGFEQYRHYRAQVEDMKVAADTYRCNPFKRRSIKGKYNVVSTVETDQPRLKDEGRECTKAAAKLSRNHAEPTRVQSQSR